MKEGRKRKAFRSGRLKFIGEKVRSQDISMGRRFNIFILSLCGALIAFAIVLLNLFGIVNPLHNEQKNAIEHGLADFSSQITRDCDENAAYAVVFSKQMTYQIQSSLNQQSITFNDLKNNSKALAALENDVYDTVCSSMDQASCSGAFYYLNTTVNDGLEEKSYSGIYLKYANLYAENTIYNEVCLYRGAAALARSKEIKLHSTWEYEMPVGVFKEIDDMMSSSEKKISQAYCLTSVYELPKTWERTRFLCIPILDENQETIGVCGFEISDLFFKLSYPANDNENDHIVCALLDREEQGRTGQISGNLSGYFPPAKDRFSLKEDKHLTSIFCDGYKFYGKTKEIQIGSSIHTAACMIPAEEYQSCVRSSQLKTALLLFILALACVIACLWMSKRYVAPLIRSLERIKSEEKEITSTHIPEIDDLFVYLDQKDRRYEEALRQKEEESEDAKKRCDKALSEIAHLRKQEIDPEQFRLFTENLKDLTPTETTVFRLYLEGKTAKEILEILGIKENTLKYHNRNIYSKLGVSSRKQLLQYASLLKEKEQE